MHGHRGGQCLREAARVAHGLRVLQVVVHDADVLRVHARERQRGLAAERIRVRGVGDADGGLTEVGLLAAHDGGPDWVVVDAVGRADDGGPVLLHIPRKADAWRHVLARVATREVHVRDLLGCPGRREHVRVVDVEVFVEDLQLRVHAQAEIERDVGRRLPFVLDVRFRVDVRQIPRDASQGLRVLRRALEVRDRRRRPVEHLVGLEGPRGSGRRHVVLAQHAADATAELPGMASEPRRGQREVIPDFLRILQHVDARRPAVQGHAGERECLAELRHALCRIGTEGEHGRVVDRVRIVAVERPLPAELIQHPRRDHPGVAAGERVARLVDAAVRVERLQAATAVAGVVLLLAGEADKQGLIRADLPVGLREVRVAVLRLGEDAFERGIELGLARVDRDVLVFLGPLGREVEVELVLDDRAANRAAELVAAIVRLRRARGIGGQLLELILGVEALVAEVLEAFTAEQVRPTAGGNRDDAAGRPAELRRRVAQVDLELLNRGLREVLPRLARARLLVPYAVDQVRAGVGESTRAEVGVELPGTHGILARARHEQRERDRLAAGQRERLDLLLRNDAGHVGLRRLDDRRRARHRH